MITIDASAALGIAVRGTVAAKTWEALESQCRVATNVLAPDLFGTEVANALWKYHHINKVPLDVVSQQRQDCMGLPSKFVSSRDLLDEAFLLACQAKHPVYDVIYMVCARRFDAPLLTLDTKLVKVADSFRIPYIKLP